MPEPDSREHLRLFLAILIPKTVRAELRRVQLELQKLLPPRAARWARPEQFHLTLKFLGNVPAKDVDALRETVRAICAAAPPMRLRAQGTGFFPDAFSPRVFWVDIKNPDGLLLRLQQQLETATERFAEKQEAKKFMAHLTLARFEKLNRRDAENFAARAQTDKIFGEWTAQEVELIQSRLLPSGALHAILDTFKAKNDGSLKLF
jgi:RNA 2',3'-cyclic 3'-phosphodiesterase